MMFRPRLPVGSTRANNGYALLLAVVITSAVLSAASALASIIVSEIRQTRQISNAMAAYAQAEESTERALFLLRQSDMPLVELATAIAPDAAITSSNDPQYFRIAENDFISLPIPAEAAGDDLQLRITRWEKDPQCSNASWVEISTVAWVPAVSPESGGPFRVLKQPYSHDNNFEQNNSLLEITFPRGTPVEARIRALYCDITNLTVENIPGRLRILSQGQQGDARQAVETLVTRKPPAAGLFDFVLFSECEVIKGAPRDPGCPQ